MKPIDIVSNYGINQDIADILSKVPNGDSELCEHYRNRFSNDGGISSMQYSKIKEFLSDIEALK